MNLFNWEVFKSLDYFRFGSPRGGCLACSANVSKHCKQTRIGSLEIYSEVSLRRLFTGGSFMLHMSKSIKTTSVWWACDFLRSSAELRSFLFERVEASCRASRDTRRHTMSSFSESALEKKLSELSSSQQSVQTLSLWIIHHRKHSGLIVKVWHRELKKGKS